MSTRVLSVLDELAAERSPLRKRQILVQRDHPDLRVALIAALHPYRMYYVRDVPPVKPAKRSSTSWQTISDTLLGPLSERTLSGNAARAKIAQVLSRLSREDGEVLRRVLRKDPECGVRRRILNAAWPGAVPEFAVQLAASDLSRAVFPCLAEPKIDGMRVLAFVGGSSADAVQFVSRGGRPVQLPEAVARRVATKGTTGWVLDGEVQADTFEGTLSAVKRGKRRHDEEQPDMLDEAAQAARLVIFDAVPIHHFRKGRCEDSLLQRRDVLERMFKHDPEMLSHQVVVSSEREARAFYDRCVAAGHEGCILKNPDAPYEFKRSAAWIKMKPQDTLDVVITGWREGRGKYSGQLGALTFTHNGLECRAGSGFSDHQRRSLWRRRSSLVGLVMEVEFTEETEAGRTRHARFLRLREHGGERS